jgi:hypothetical protein
VTQNFGAYFLNLSFVGPVQICFCDFSKPIQAIDLKFSRSIEDGIFEIWHNHIPGISCPRPIVAFFATAPG